MDRFVIRTTKKPRLQQEEREHVQSQQQDKRGRKLHDLSQQSQNENEDKNTKRQRILAQTLARIYHLGEENLRNTAKQNLQRWKAQANKKKDATHKCVVHVLPGDWGDVTLQMTKLYGTTFASLNMANAYGPGGGYVEGCAAQEENMFRRTDCHFSLMPAEMNHSRSKYIPEMSALINAEEGRVYLDTECPRFCIRGSEDRHRQDLGYPWLASDEIFPFYELRAAAVDLRFRGNFDERETLRRVCAQLDTLIDAGVRHAVLGAFGCGAFRNPTERVAAVYRHAIDTRADQFDVIAFAIFHAGYGPNNFKPFYAAFSDCLMPVPGQEPCVLLGEDESGDEFSAF